MTMRYHGTRMNYIVTILNSVMSKLEPTRSLMLRGVEAGYKRRMRVRQQKGQNNVNGYPVIGGYLPECIVNYSSTVVSIFVAGTPRGSISNDCWGALVQ